MIDLDPKETALVLIDLQGGIVSMTLEPRTGAEIAAAGIALAERFREAGGLVVLVRVAWDPSFADTLSQPVDQPMGRPEGGLLPSWSALIDGLAQPGDLQITKRQWGAFFGTELDLQLRRRGVTTVVVAGIATNFGVESTVRQAWEHGYAVVVPEDSCASVSAALHFVAMEKIFPRLARVTTTADLRMPAGART